MMKKRPLCIATRNRHKVEEMIPPLSPYWKVTSSEDYPGMEEIVETGDTFMANASLKAMTTSMAVPDYVLADDSGLEVDALGGAPGVFSARYGGIPSSTEKNNAKLLEELQRVGAMKPEQRTARYRCILVLAQRGRVMGSFDGTCEGTITLTEKGTHGFGYDPLFIPRGYEQTFGELDEKTKMKLSHRAIALEKFLAWCKKNPR